MWTPATRRQHSRAGLRYEPDLTDAEWAVIAPLMPEPAACGRPATWTTREILNAIFYVLRGGIAWRLIPKDLPPKSTAFGSFSRWRDEGLFGRINRALGDDRQDRPQGRPRHRPAAAHGLVPAGALQVGARPGGPGAAGRAQATAGQNARRGAQLAGSSARLRAQGGRDQQRAVRGTGAHAGRGSHDAGADRTGHVAGARGAKGRARQTASGDAGDRAGRRGLPTVDDGAGRWRPGGRHFHFRRGCPGAVRPLQRGGGALWSDPAQAPVG